MHSDFIKEVLSFFSLVARTRNASPEALQLLSAQLPSLAPINIEAIRSQTPVFESEEGEELVNSINGVLERAESLSSPYLSKVKAFIALPGLVCLPSRSL
jgi:hypothetical protein